MIREKKKVKNCQFLVSQKGNKCEMKMNWNVPVVKWLKKLPMTQICVKRPFKGSFEFNIIFRGGGFTYFMCSNVHLSLRCFFWFSQFGRHPCRHQVWLYILPNVPGDLEFKPKVQGEIKKTNWFQLTYIQGLKNQPPRHYDERSFKAVYPFLEKIKLWVDTEKRDGREF